MKLQRMHELHEMKLWDFLKMTIPKSLKAIERGVGDYGLEYIIGTRAIFGVGEDIARVTDCANGEAVIEIYSPKYFSDFETLVQSFETRSGREVTVQYWET